MSKIQGFLFEPMSLPFCVPASWHNFPKDSKFWFRTYHDQPGAHAPFSVCVRGHNEGGVAYWCYSFKDAMNAANWCLLQKDKYFHVVIYAEGHDTPGELVFCLTATKKPFTEISNRRPYYETDESF
jgi:hypothetical protein